MAIVTGGLWYTVERDTRMRIYADKVRKRDFASEFSGKPILSSLVIFIPSIRYTNYFYPSIVLKERFTL